MLESETNPVVSNMSETLPFILAPAFNSMLRLRLIPFGLESWSR
jgi:cellobiose-specific phosphotransferase system component IIC